MTKLSASETAMLISFVLLVCAYAAIFPRGSLPPSTHLPRSHQRYFNCSSTSDCSCYSPSIRDNCSNLCNQINSHCSTSHYSSFKCPCKNYKKCKYYYGEKACKTLCYGHSYCNGSNGYQKKTSNTESDIDKCKYRCDENLAEYPPALYNDCREECEDYDGQCPYDSFITCLDSLEGTQSDGYSDYAIALYCDAICPYENAEGGKGSAVYEESSGGQFYDANAVKKCMKRCEKKLTGDEALFVEDCQEFCTYWGGKCPSSNSDCKKSLKEYLEEEYDDDDDEDYDWDYDWGYANSFEDDVVDDWCAALCPTNIVLIIIIVVVVVVVIIAVVVVVVLVLYFKHLACFAPKTAGADSQKVETEMTPQPSQYPQTVQNPIQSQPYPPQSQPYPPPSQFPPHPQYPPHPDYTPPQPR